MKKEYTLTIYTENQVGLINKIAIMFSRRKISLESLNTSPSEIENIYRFTLVLCEAETVIRNLVRQLEKLIDVLKVYYNTNEEIIWQQMALYKVATSTIMKDVKVERLLREYGAKAVVIREDFTVFETTGQNEEINNLLKELHKYGLIEFVRSSRIAIIKSSIGVHQDVLDMERNDPTKLPINNEYLNLKSKIFQM
ncbi:MAG: acetolactate synthase small subunit [Saprospiraceae bacterium]|jgi:acetolactate synthase-1/3 small subunit|uniref:acetolactate synthase small subunit n=1 Tax=Candidatus Brachybacter algidus TaxID=2982024 RepID=UPI001B7A2F52|nr:acetolactate synthase small subunit [Candidatus Brachybacter algidus]MBP7305867.1 acetolactate synthase small subunit [Saprospiraceae bacterium]MBK6449030.1 acetolactate synthase small subunit [Candidatus Brachybacter algidus]MBK7601992.1 acetolactate synthase small subunit [Candidatus Brachybacter algidus]MBK8355629.1 acetolactate synthase small subunit [Candidatus Brachybacter algidus]MBK8843468.1 acetolactate synthase small subunit [Candidatus Brachybacter algidus]